MDTTFRQGGCASPDRRFIPSEIHRKMFAAHLAGKATWEICLGPSHLDVDDVTQPKLSRVIVAAPMQNPLVAPHRRADSKLPSPASHARSRHATADGPGIHAMIGPGAVNHASDETLTAPMRLVVGGVLAAGRPEQRAVESDSGLQSIVRFGPAAAKPKTNNISVSRAEALPPIPRKPQARSRSAT
jgi:hypothetical protein